MIVLTSKHFVFGLKSLNFLVMFLRPDLIISNSFIGNSQLVLTIFEILFTLLDLLFQIFDSLLIAIAVILKWVHACFLLVHILLKDAFPAIEFLNSLDLLFLSLKGMLSKGAVLVQVLDNLVVVHDLRLLVVVLQQL